MSIRVFYVMFGPTFIRYTNSITQQPGVTGSCVDFSFFLAFFLSTAFDEARAAKRPHAIVLENAGEHLHLKHCTLLYLFFHTTQCLFLSYYLYYSRLLPDNSDHLHSFWSLSCTFLLFFLNLFSSTTSGSFLSIIFLSLISLAMCLLAAIIVP